MRLINLTPHVISIYNREGTEVLLELPAYPKQVRCKMTTDIIGYSQIDHNGKVVPIDNTLTHFDDVINLPDPKPGIIFIVSKLVAEKMKGKRDDLRIANGTMRNESKTIIGCRSLGII